MAILALALLFVAAAVQGAEALGQLKILIDADNNPTTGCSIVTPAGQFDGAEWVVTSTINPATVQVVALAAQQCIGGALGAPTAVTSPFPPPWPVGVGVGLNGSDLVETYLAPFINVGGVIRVGFVYDNSAGVVSTLLTKTGAASGPPILVALAPAAIPTLGTVGLALLVILLLISGAILARRRGVRTSVWVTILALTAGIGLVWAAVMLDGQSGDWAGQSPIATGNGGGLQGAFSQQDNGITYFRVDGPFVCDPITVNPATLPGGAINQAYGPVNFTQTGGQGTITWSVTGALPTGMSFSAAGVLSGTPTQSGNFPLTFKATDSRGCVGTQAITLVIAATSAPTITSANATTFTVGQAGSFTVTTTGLPTPSITRTGALPAGVNFVDNGDGTGTLSGTPAAGTGGQYAITFTAVNGIAPDAVQNFTLTVNQPPTITSGNATTFTVGTAGSFTVTTTGFPAPSIARGGVALPAGVNFVDNGNGTGTLSGTPAAGTGGTYAITFTASNAAGSSGAQNFTLTVNEAPAITSANTTTFTVGALGTFTVTTTGFPTGAAMNISEVGALPTGVNFVNNGNGTATLSGTPAAGTGGSYPITITANNGVAPNATQNFTLVVGQAPTISSANATTFTVGTAGNFMVTTTGFPAPSIARGGVALPANVTFVDNGNGTGTLSGTPAAGTGGTYAITFTATNAAGSSPVQNFTLTVNEAPTITSANSVTFQQNVFKSFTVTTTGFPTGASMSITEVGALPTGVNFVNNNNGTATISGTTNAGGTYPIQITANNGVTPNATQNFTILVEQAPTITSANSKTFTVGVNDSHTVTTTGVPDVNSITMTSVTPGPGGTLPTGINFSYVSGTTATLGGTATNGAQVGNYVVKFTASNGVPPNFEQNFTLTLVCPAITVSRTGGGAFPDAVFNSAYTGQSVTATGGTGPHTFQVTAGTFPPGLSLASGGAISGTPTNTGSFNFTVTATDANGCTGSQAF
ncbi:MAG: beta strand repeat-containing protein, partial [Gammaproteobacteria bacterium]